MDTASKTPRTDANDGASALHGDLFKNDYYVLSTTIHGTVRLALQQYIWQQALGFNIHPSIPELSRSSCVADVACGTCLWLIDVGRQIGTDCELHGFDIHLEQAPPQPWLPDNLSLHRWNIFDDVPEEFVGKFDLVHVRLITVVIKDNESAVTVMKNLYKLLKPGGYLQWDEVDVPNSFVMKAYPDVEVPALKTLCQRQSATARDREGLPSLNWSTNATTLLVEHGFSTADRHDMRETFISRKELMRYNSDQLLMVLEQYARRVFSSSHAARDDVLKLIEQAATETEKGAALVMPPFSIVAHKGTVTNE